MLGLKYKGVLGFGCGLLWRYLCLSRTSPECLATLTHIRSLPATPKEREHNGAPSGRLRPSPVCDPYSPCGICNNMSHVPLLSLQMRMVPVSWGPGAADRSPPPCPSIATTWRGEWTASLRIPPSIPHWLQVDWSIVDSADDISPLPYHSVGSVLSVQRLIHLEQKRSCSSFTSGRKKQTSNQTSKH